MFNNTSIHTNTDMSINLIIILQLYCNIILLLFLLIITNIKKPDNIYIYKDNIKYKNINDISDDKPYNLDEDITTDSDDITTDSDDIIDKEDITTDIIKDTTTNIIGCGQTDCININNRYFCSRSCKNAALIDNIIKDVDISNECNLELTEKSHKYLFNL